jgi:hypothetical protein
MNGVPRASYEALLEVRGDAPVPRFAYLEGTLGLMRPSRDHERSQSFIGCLVGGYALDHEVEFSPYGLWTFRSALKQAG